MSNRSHGERARELLSALCRDATLGGGVASLRCLGTTIWTAEIWLMEDDGSLHLTRRGQTPEAARQALTDAVAEIWPQGGE